MGDELDVNDHRAASIVEGAVAGLIATVPMTVLMFAWHRTLPVSQRHPLPPSLITRRLLGGEPPSVRPEPMPNLLSALAAHFGFGGVAGAMYATVPLTLRQSCPATTGIGYGLCIWAASYLGWVPGLGLLPPATRQPAGRNIMMIAAHVVWGATLGLASHGLQSTVHAGRGPSEYALRPDCSVNHRAKESGA